VPPTLKGSIAGKPFEAASACVGGMTGTDAYIEIYDANGDATKGCGVLSKTPGARKIGLTIDWVAGKKVDAASLKSNGKNSTPLFVMDRVSAEKVERKDAGVDFTPVGSVEVLKAGGPGSVGRIRFSVTAGKDKLEGEVDVDVH
jgi:hypothetical protein